MTFPKIGEEFRRGVKGRGGGGGVGAYLCNINKYDDYSTLVMRGVCTNSQSAANDEQRQPAAGRLIIEIK